MGTLPCPGRGFGRPLTSLGRKVAKAFELPQVHYELPAYPAVLQPDLPPHRLGGAHGVGEAHPQKLLPHPVAGLPGGHLEGLGQSREGEKRRREGSCKDLCVRVRV